MAINGFNVAAFFGQPSGLTGALFQRGPTAATTEPSIALRRAEQNQADQMARQARQPQTARELERFQQGVARAQSVDDLLRNRDVLRVMLTARGLESQINAAGLVRRVLTSDLSDPNSAANQMGRAQPAWLALAREMDFRRDGLANIKNSTAVARLQADYVEARWVDSLEQQAPGLSFAFEFKQRARTIDSEIRVLGDPVVREVVTTTLGIPREIARLSLEAQERAIRNRLDVKDFQDPQFVDNFARRYLLAVNTGSGNINVRA